MSGIESVDLDSPGTFPKSDVNAFTDPRLFEHPENLFDLNGKGLKFVPSPSGYAKTQVPLDFRPTGDELAAANPTWDGRSWRVALPFAFPFGGKTYSELFVNLSGSVSFERSEAELWNERNPWASGGMLSVASAILARASLGLERMIAANWAEYSAPSSRVWFSRGSTQVTITWDVTRPKAGHIYYEPLGSNRFQMQLHASGEIHLHYADVKERDGIVGIFAGVTTGGEVVDAATGSGTASDPRLKVDQVEVRDVGALQHFVVRTGQDVVFSADESATYRLQLRAGVKRCEIALYYVAGQPYRFADCSSAPFNFQYKLEGSQLTFVVPKMWLAGQSRVYWRLETFGKDTYTDLGGEPGRPVTLDPRLASGFDLSEAGEKVAGDVLEVFHYTPFIKLFRTLLPLVYEQYAADDDFAVFFTDFRMDEIYGGGEAAGSVNFKIDGIGPAAANPIDGKPWGSERLQNAVSPAYLGQYQFQKTIHDDGREFRNYAWTIGWLGHEITHRWTAFMHHQDPATGEVTSLVDDSGFHWDWRVHLPSMAKVSSRYAADAYPESSPMGGNHWVEESDGAARLLDKPYVVPFGMSGLDLYAMGLIDAESMPATFYLKNATKLEGDRYRFTRVPITAAGLIRAHGERIPSAAQAQKEFKLGMYFIHKPGVLPDPVLLAQAKEVHAELIRYFSLATAGRMTMK